MTTPRLYDLLKKHEDVRLRPYVDSVGKLTIGCGRNLTDVGLSQEESEYLLENDVNRACFGAVQFEWFKTLDDVRQDAVIDMIFNLGIGNFRLFTKLIAALAKGEWMAASREMLDSHWASEVGQRARDLAHMIETGCY